MSRRAPIIELQAIEEIIQQFPEGASLDEIQRKLPKVARRTLQDRIRMLIGEGRAVKVGERRWSRYRLEKMAAAQGEEPTGFKSLTLPLSEQGSRVRSLVSRPLNARKPVGYDRLLLDRYKPNNTFYLSDNQRTHLLQRGKGDLPPAPAGTYAREILSRLLIDLSWNSSRLEGNTYSLLVPRHRGFDGKRA